MYPLELARAREESEGRSEPDPAFDALLNDLIVYLACRLDVPPDVVLTRLGDWLVDPVWEERRQHYARANHLRGGT